MDYKELRENIAKNFYSKYAQDLSELAKMASKNDIINPKLYEKYDVKRGLRDVNGNGVVCGLTEISEIQAFKKDKDGTKHPTEGQLYYRGETLTVNGGETGRLTRRLYETLTGIQYGRLADPYGWTHPV